MYVRYSILFSASEVVPSATLTPTSLPGVRAFAGEVHDLGHGASSSTVSNLSEEWFEGQFPEVGVNSDMSSNDEDFAGSLAGNWFVVSACRVGSSRSSAPTTGWC